MSEDLRERIRKVLILKTEVKKEQEKEGRVSDLPNFENFLLNLINTSK